MKASKLVSVLLLAGGAACGQKSCSAGAEESIGGTALRIPVEGTSDRIENPEVEYYECGCGKKQPDAWRYDRCACGKPWKPTPKRIPRPTRFAEGALWFVHGGDFEVLYAVRLSVAERVARDAGLQVKREGFLLGPFAVHVGTADLSALLPALRKLKGVGQAEAAGGILYVNQDRSEGKVEYAAMERLFKAHAVAIEDLSWVVHRCYGEIGFVAK